MTNNAEHILEGHTAGYKYIKASMIRIDTEYQRAISKSKINRMVKEWNIDICDPLKVSQRKDGTYWVFDGGHRLTAHKIMYGDDAPIMCRVYTGLTYAEEVRLFRDQNGIHTSVATRDDLRAGYNTGDEEVRNMVRSCAICGVRVSFEKRCGRTKYSCNCVEAMNDAYKTLPPDLFVRMLNLIGKTWDGDCTSYQAGFIKGMKKLFLVTGGKFSDSEMKKSLSKYTPDYFARNARDVNGTLEMRYFKMFVKAYNVKRTTNRIEVE